MLFDFFVSVAMLIIGSLLIFKTADILVQYASKLIRGNKIPIPVVGVLLLPLITGLPNLFISISSILNGLESFVYLNNLGNTIGNLTLALGITVLLGRKFIIRKTALVKRDALFLCVSSLITVLLMADGLLSNVDGLILILVFGFYAFNLHREETKKIKPENVDLAKIALIAIISLVVMFFGAELVVTGAKGIMNQFSLTETFAGVIIVGLAAILPETSVMVLASRRGNIGLSFSNLIGDTRVSVPFIVGLIAIFYPLNISQHVINLLLPIVALLVIFFMIIIWFDPFLFRIPNKFDIKKHEAVFLILLYIVIAALLY